MIKATSILSIILLSLAACKPLPQANYDPNLPTKWKYATQFDDVRQKNVDYAYIKSNEAVDLPTGKMHAELTIMRVDQASDEVISLSVKNAKFYCPFGKCKLTARVGNSIPYVFDAVTAHDGSTDEILIKDNEAKLFANSVLQASTVVIGATFYKAGEKEITFDTANINWPGYSIY